MLHDDDNGPKPNDLTWLAKVEEYLALPDHPDYDTSKDDSIDQPYKNGTWKDEDAGDEYHDARWNPDALYQALEWKFKRMRKVLHPEPGDADAFDRWESNSKQADRDHHRYNQVNLQEEFRDQGLQVIVKSASVELTPEKPEYEGGNWHLEVRSSLIKSIVSTSLTSSSIGNGERA